MCEHGHPSWLLRLGVDVVYARPYHPQSRGKNERFHRTLKAEVLGGRSFGNLEETQAAFDAWREIYNTRRPHSSHRARTPDVVYFASLHQPSADAA